MGINIPLIDNWRIKSDKHQFILVREENNRETNEGFYSDFESCVSAFIDKKIKLFNATSIQGLLNSIKAFHTALSKALLPLKLRVVPLDTSFKSSIQAGQELPSPADIQENGN